MSRSLRPKQCCHLAATLGQRCGPFVGEVSVLLEQGTRGANYYAAISVGMKGASYNAAAISAVIRRLRQIRQGWERETSPGPPREAGGGPADMGA